jgi:hypothetical protein
MTSFVVVAVLAVLSGCASNEVRVSCDGRLQPINPPAPVAKEAQKPAAAISAQPTGMTSTRNAQ